MLLQVNPCTMILCEGQKRTLLNLSSALAVSKQAQLPPQCLMKHRDRENTVFWLVLH